MKLGQRTDSKLWHGASRREFCCGAAALLLEPGCVWGRRLASQAQTAAAGSSSRPDVAAIDRQRILTEADQYMRERPVTLTSLPCLRSPGTAHDYYSEAEVAPAAAEAAKPAETAFTAHRDAVFALGLQAPALAAAHLLTGDAKYAMHGAAFVRAWFLDPATRMTPRLDYGHVLPPEPALEHAPAQTNAEFRARALGNAPRGGTFEGIIETVPLVEVAQAVPFLAAAGALSDDEASRVQAWFAAYLNWLTAPEDSGPRLPALARDRKDHHGTSWMLQAIAFSLLTAPENGEPKAEAKSMDDLRHRFRTVTVRAQIAADGMFPHELTGVNPYRDSLFNLDMLAAICALLGTRFESVWDFQLEDGPGVRGAVAYHFPFIADRAKWPFRADAEHFTELPGRRVSLLLAARAYHRPEYAALWESLTPGAASPEVLRTMPIQQPLLWVTPVHASTRRS